MARDQAERIKPATREWDVMDSQEETALGSSNDNAGSRQGKNTVSYARKSSILGPPDELRATLAHQIEFEIALRKRVAKVVEARIRWAEELKETLLQGIAGFSHCH